MANQKKLALQAKVDLKRFIIDRSLSMEIEGTRIWFMMQYVHSQNKFYLTVAVQYFILLDNFRMNDDIV